MSVLTDFWAKEYILLDSCLGTFSALFFVRAFGTLKKEVQEGLQNETRFLVDFGVCPEGLRRVPVYTGAQFSLCSRTQKGLQNGSQNGAFWAPKSELYSLWAPFVRNWCPKSCIEKRLQNLGGRGAAASIRHGVLVPLKDNPEHP